MKKERIEFLDITKGICMLLVIWTHIVSQFNIDNKIINITSEFIVSFYMPLFFIISGMFLKVNMDFKTFLLKKVNTILIPFIIFYVISFIVAYIVSELFKIKLNNSFSWYNIFSIVKSETFSNGAIWFLSSLFFASIIYYLIAVLTKGNQIKMVCLIISFSLIGYYWSKIFKFRLPFFIDTSLTSLFFIYTGSEIIKYLSLLKEKKYLKYIVLVVSFSLTFILRNYGGAMVSNGYSYNFLFYYLVGISGTLSVISFSSFFKKIPVINLIGVFSIIPLCTHYFLIKPLKLIIGKVVHDQIYVALIMLVIILIIMISIIPVMKKYFSYLFGLKPIIK